MALTDTDQKPPAPGTVVDGYRFKGGEPGDQANWEPTEPSKAPSAGQVVDGYRFKGGKASDKANWEPVQQPAKEAAGAWRPQLRSRGGAIPKTRPQPTANVPQEGMSVGGSSTGLDMHSGALSMPSKPGTLPDALDNPAVQQLREGYRGMDASYPEANPTNEQPAGTETPMPTNRKPREFAYGEGGYAQRKDGTVIDARDARIERDFEENIGKYTTLGLASGKQYTPEREKAMRDAGTWTDADELRKSQAPLALQADLLRRKQEQLKKDAEKYGVGDIEARATMLKDDLLYLRGEIEKMQQEGADPAAFNEMAAQFNEKLGTYQQQMKVLEPFIEEQKDIQDGMAYLQQKHADAEKAYATSPEGKRKKAVQGMADDRFKAAQSQWRKGNWYAPEVINQYVVSPITSTVTKGIFNAAGALGRGVDLIGNIPNAVVGKTPYYSNFAAAADNLFSAAEELTPTPQVTLQTKDGPKLGHEPMFNEDWDLQTQTLLPKVLQAATYMSLLGVSGAAGGEAGMMGASYLTTEEDYYKEAIGVGMKPGQAQMFAMTSASLTALLEKVNPGPFLNGKTVKGAMMERAVKALRDGKNWEAAIKDGTAYVLKEGAGEGLQEGLQALGDDAVKGMAKLTLGSEADGLEFNTPQAYAENVLLGVALGAIAATGGKIGDRPLHMQALDWAVRNREKLTEYINASPYEDKATVLANLETIAAIYEGNDLEGMAPEKAAKAASLIQQIEEVQEDISAKPMNEVVASVKEDPRGRKVSEMTKELALLVGAPAEEVEEPQPKKDVEPTANKPTVPAPTEPEPAAGSNGAPSGSARTPGDANDASPGVSEEAPTDQEAGVPAEAEPPKAVKPKKKPTVDEAKEDRKRVLKDADNITPEEMGPAGVAERYLANGGKVNTQSLIRELGYRNPGSGQLSSEFGQRIWAHSNDSPSIEAVAGKIAEGTNLDEQEVREALIDALRNATGRNSLIENLRDRLPKSMEEQERDWMRQQAQDQDMAELVLESPMTPQEDADADAELEAMTPERMQALADEHDEYVSQQRPPNEKAQDGPGTKQGKGNAGAEEAPSEERGKAEAEWQAEFTRLSADVDAANRERNKAAADFNKRGQVLFSEDVGTSEPGMFDDGAADNSKENYERIIAPLKAKVKKTSEALAAHVEGKEKFIADRVAAGAKQTRVDDTPSAEDKVPIPKKEVSEPKPAPTDQATGWVLSGTSDGDVAANKVAQAHGVAVDEGPITTRPAYSNKTKLISFPGGLSDAAFAEAYGATKEQVMAHEVGHAILDQLGMPGGFDGPAFKDLRDELRPISKSASSKKWEVASRHANKGTELVADGIAHLIQNPDAKLPLLRGLIGDRVKSAAEPKQPFANVSEEKRKRAEALRESIRKRIGGQLNAGFDPKLLAEAIEYGAIVIENGARGFAAFVKEMVDAFGPPVKRYLRGAYKGARDWVEEGRDEMTPDAEVDSADLDELINTASDERPDVPSKPDDSEVDTDLDDGLPADAGAGTGTPGKAPKGGGVDVPTVPGERGGVPGAPSPGGSGVGGDKGNAPANGGPKKVPSGSGKKPTAGGSGAPRVDDPNAVNHVLPRNEDWIPKGPKTKAKANVAAIKLLVKLEEEDRNATPAEKDVLARYTGWGGLKAAVDRDMIRLAKRVKNNEINTWDWQGKEQIEKANNWTKEWGEIHEAIDEVLSQEEQDQIFSSSEYAHYSSRTVINAMWDAVLRMGFKGGSVLESAVGVGHFFGLAPASVRDNLQLLGIDKDSVSARIAMKLYPQADIRHSGYEKVKIRPNSQDLVITNVPFSQNGVFDPNYPKGLNLHNYFIVRGLDELKPGGIMAVITSSFTMDSASMDARKLMGDRADFIGAVRLPKTAFKENAGTEVVADILFFRKPDHNQFAGQPFSATTQVKSIEGYDTYPTGYKKSLEEWHALSDEQKVEEIRLSNLKSNLKYSGGKPITERQFRVNEYFQQHPEMVLGDLSLTGSMRGFDPSMTVLPNDVPLEKALADALATLPENIFGAEITKPTDPKLMDVGAREGRLRMTDGVPGVPDAYGKVVPPKWYEKADKAQRAKMVKQAESYIKVRDAIESLIEAEHASDTGTEAKRATLNEVYDAYVAEFGNVRDGNKSEFLALSDRDFPIVGALESARLATAEEKAAMGKGLAKRALDSLLKKKTWVYEKMPIFRQQTVHPVTRPDMAETIDEAVDISVNWLGRIDLPYLAELIGKDEEAVKAKLRESGLAYENPRTGVWEESHLYLSGFVVEKLKEAKAAAESDPFMEQNVAALEAAQPKPISLEKIIKPKDPGDAPTISSQWIPPSVYESFSKKVLGVSVRVSHLSEIGKFAVEYDTSDYDYKSAKNTKTWGVPYQKSQGGKTKGQVALTGVNLLERLLRQRGISVKWTYQKEDFKDPDATELADAKAKELNEAFIEFLGKDADAGLKVEKAFNKQFNLTVRTVHKLPTMKRPPGMSETFVDKEGKVKTLELYDHQRIAVARAMRNSTMFAHGVGFGKTLEMAAIAMELRRLGLAKKPMVAVMNSTLDQIRGEFQQLYPWAKIHAPSPKDMDGPLERNIFMAQAAMGDWDIVLITHPILDRIPNDPEREKAWINEEIAELIAARDARIDVAGKSASGVQDYNSLITTMSGKLDELLQRQKDNAMTFEQLGVDALLVDESHNYKKLPFRSALASDREAKVKGIDTGSDASQGPSLLLKMRFVQAMNRGRNTFLFTGTPVTNTIAELWTIMRYVRPDILQKYGITTFDAFQTAFTVVNAEFERTSTGAIKLVKRLTRFRYLQRLMDAWLQAADVRFSAKDAGVKQPGVRGGGPQVRSLRPTERLRDFVVYLAWKYDQWQNLPADVREREGLQAIPATMAAWARLGAMDMRYIDSTFPEERGSAVGDVVVGAKRVAADMPYIDPAPPDDLASKANEVIADMKRATAAMGHVGPTFMDKPGSKVNEVIRDVKRIYDEHSDVNGTQFMFTDQIWSVDGGINIYLDLKRKLIAAGIPEKEIVLVHPDFGLDTAEKKQAAFDKINSGEYRVAVGSTASLGTGVNAQKLSSAGHHLDAPWMPFQITQREGRSIRAGNLIYEEHKRLIDVLRWVVESSYDGTLWGILTAKADMVGQMIDGSYEGDELADLGEAVTMSFAQAKAAATGDNRFILKAEFLKEIASQTLKKNAHAAAQRSFIDQINKIEEFIPKAEKNLEEYRAVAKDYEGRFDANRETTAEIDGAKIIGRKEVYEGLERKFAAIKTGVASTREEARSLGMEDKGLGKFTSPAGIITVNGKKIALSRALFFNTEPDGSSTLGSSEIEFHIIDDQLEQFRGGTEGSAPGFFHSLNAIMSRVEARPSMVESDLAAKRRDLAEAKSQMGSVFDTLKLEEAEAGLEKVEKSLAENPEPVLEKPKYKYPDIFVKAAVLKNDAAQARHDAAQEENEGGDDDPAPTKPKKPKGKGPSGKAKEIADKLRDAGDSIVSGDKAFGHILPPQLYRAALRLAADVIEVTGDLVEAAIKAAEYIRNSDWFQGLSIADQLRADEDIDQMSADIESGKAGATDPGDGLSTVQRRRLKMDTDLSDTEAAEIRSNPLYEKYAYRQMKDAAKAGMAALYAETADMLPLDAIAAVRKGIEQTVNPVSRAYMYGDLHRQMHELTTSADVTGPEKLALQKEMGDLVNTMAAMALQAGRTGAIFQDVYNDFGMFAAQTRGAMIDQQAAADLDNKDKGMDGQTPREVIDKVRGDIDAILDESPELKAHIAALQKINQALREAFAIKVLAGQMTPLEEPPPVSIEDFLAGKADKRIAELEETLQSTLDQLESLHERYDKVKGRKHEYAKRINELRTKLRHAKEAIAKLGEIKKADTAIKAKLRGQNDVLAQKVSKLKLLFEAAALAKKAGRLRRLEKPLLQEVLEVVRTGALWDDDMVAAFGNTFDLHSFTEQERTMVQHFAYALDYFEDTDQREMSNRFTKEMNLYLDKAARSVTRSARVSRFMTEVFFHNALSAVGTFFNSNVGSSIQGIVGGTAASLDFMLRRDGGLGSVLYGARRLWQEHPASVSKMLHYTSAYAKRGGYFTANEGAKGSVFEAELLNGFFKAWDKAKKADTIGAKVKWGSVMIASALSQATRVGFMMRGADAYLTHSLVSFRQGMMEYEQFIKDEHIPKTLANYWLQRIKVENFAKIDNAVGYGEQTRAAAGKQADQDIANLVASGMKVPAGYRARRISEILEDGRDKEMYELNVELARDMLLMGSPDGLPGHFAEAVAGYSSVRDNDGPGIALRKWAIATLLPFMRIQAATVNAAQQGLPILGFVGNAYGWRKDKDGNWGFGNKKAESPERYRQRMATSALLMGIFLLSAYNLFDWDDDDDEEEDGKKLVPNPDRLFDVSAQAYGNYKLNQGIAEDYQKYSIRFKNGDGWSDYYSTKLFPGAASGYAIMGRLMDDAKGLYLDRKGDRKDGPASMMETVAGSTIEQLGEASFSSIGKAVNKWRYARDMDQTQGVFFDMLMQPIITTAQPAIYRDAINVAAMIAEEPMSEKKRVDDMGDALRNSAASVYGLDMLLLNDKVDEFGIPVERKDAVRAWVHGFQDDHVRSVDHKETALRFKYPGIVMPNPYNRPNSLRDPMIPTGLINPNDDQRWLSDEQKDVIDLYSRAKFREIVASNYDALVKASEEWEKKVVDEVGIAGAGAAYLTKEFSKGRSAANKESREAMLEVMRGKKTLDSMREETAKMQRKADSIMLKPAQE